MTTTFSRRTVPDTNIIIASQTNNPDSPNREYLNRWQRDEFALLYSDDTLHEYIEKLLGLGIEESLIQQLVIAILALGEQVSIEYFHLRHYPTDADDIAFLLCGVNGQATHLITYDAHLLDLAPYYRFSICRPVLFLQELRHELENQDGDR